MDTSSIAASEKSAGDRRVRSIAIVGAGGVGGLYGGMLAKAGYDVHFLERRDTEAVRRRGWKVHSIWGDFTIPEPQVYADASQMPACDLIIVAIKSTANAALEMLLPPLLHERSIALVLQNGLFVEEDTARIVGEGRVIGGCCFLCSNKISPGQIHHLDYGRIEMGGYRGVDGKATQVSDSVLALVGDCLATAGIPVDVLGDLRLARWRKLMWNIPFNGLSVALNASTDQIMRHDASRQLARDLMEEVYKAASAGGVRIDDGHLERMMDHTANMVPYDSSMRLDYRGGRPMELEYIYRQPIEAARRAGFEPLRIDTLYQVLRFMQDHRSDKTTTHSNA